MNKDYTSDIKQVERFMFDNSIYLLNMFQKKIDSFINTKTKKGRQKQLFIHRQQNNRLDPNNFFDDPIKSLARDLTKPIWNCVVKMDPTVYLEHNNPHSFDNQNLEQVEQVNQKRLLFVNLLNSFFHRYKTEHEDQSNLKININNFSRTDDIKKIQEKQIVQVHQEYTKHLFQLLMRCIQRENQFLQSLPDLGEVQENYQHLRSTLEAYSQVITLYLEESESIKKQMNWFTCLLMQGIINILDSKSGPTLFMIQPKIGFINLLIHPLLVGIHNCLSVQFNHNQKEKINKEKNKQKPQNKEMMQDEKQKSDGEQEKKSEQSYVFKDLKFNNCSRIAFINLDGYESQYNLDVVKYLSKYMLYVSFPKQSLNNKQSNPLKQFQHYKSERLLRKFFYQSLTVEQKNQLLKLHEIQQKQFKKNMFILPVNLRALTQKYQLNYQQHGTCNNSIEFYQSTFIKFMMEQVVMSHIREFNPSIVIISYSEKIKIQNEYFTEMIKQLTVISNFRLLLYPNKSKIFCFQEKNSNIVAGQDFFNLQEQYYKQYQQNNIDIFHHDNSMNQVNQLCTRNLDLNFLDKLSIFLKVSSGTYNLSKTVQQDSYIEKYKNYKIMRYSALLLKNMGKEYSTIQRLKMRANQYLTISKVLKNNYANKSQTFDKLFDKVISKYHDFLIKTVEKILFIQKAYLDNPVPTNGVLTPQQEYLVFGCKSILQMIYQNFDYVQKKQIWQDFKFQYRLQLSTEKTENRFYLHIPKYKDKTIINSSKNLQDLMVAIEFQIIEQKQKIPVQLTTNTKILYSKQRQFKEALVYLINHIPKQKSTNYSSFYGILNQLIDQKSESKIQLRHIVFNSRRKMSQFQHYIDFNYFQTQKYIFMFWPRVFSDVKQKLYRILGQKYTPQTTWDIFRADRLQPGIFHELYVMNQDYQYIIPRIGCTCYKSRQHNRIYIFGGFYNNTQNYLKFQTDISFLDYTNDNYQIEIHQVPKQFFLTIQQNQETRTAFYIKQFKNDFVRPKIQYEVFQVQNKNQMHKKEIFLIGGVGQKFIRPFSMISYTGHKVIFNQNDEIESVRRIKTNNLLPVNIQTPVKCRSPQQMNIVTNAQNRNIYLNEGTTTYDSVIVSHYRYFYDQNEQKFDFETVYQFADLEKRNYREQTLHLRKAPTQYPLKYELMACSFRGKQFYNNFIKVSSQNGKKYIFELQLQLSIQVKNIFQNYQKIVRLTGASILAIDINASMLYCLIKHPSFTLDKCILAHFDINQLAGKLIDSKTVQINLKEIHKFDVDVSKNIIVVANSSTVAVLHGYKFNKDIQVSQMILKKYRKNQIKTFPIKCSEQKSLLIDQKILSKQITNQISSSFFINQNSGIIICLTFKTIERIKMQNHQAQSSRHSFIQVVYLRVQRLDMTKDQYRWKMIYQKVYKFQIKPNDLQESFLKRKNQENQMFLMQSLAQESFQRQFISHKPQYMRLIEVKGSKESKQKKQKQFLIKAVYNEQIYTCLIHLDNSPQILTFGPVNQSEQEYYKSIYKQNIKQESILLEKGLQKYEEIKQANMMQNQMNFGSITSIQEVQKITQSVGIMELQGEGK